MANDTFTLADARDPEIEVLYAGNLADDDLLWVVRCSFEEFRRLLQEPRAWVSALGELPGWKAGGEAPPAPILAPSFALVASDARKDDPQGWITVQGISETNELSVSFPASAATGSDPFAEFWKELASDPENPPSMTKPLLTTVVRPNGRFYAHFEILQEKDTAEERARRTARFLLAATLDPSGYAKMLATLDQRTNYAESGSSEPGPAITIKIEGAPRNVYAHIDATETFEIAGPMPELVCGLLFGDFDGDGVANETMVKRYGVEGGKGGPE